MADENSRNLIQRALDKIRGEAAPAPVDYAGPVATEAAPAPLVPPTPDPSIPPALLDPSQRTPVEVTAEQAMGQALVPPIEQMQVPPQPQPVLDTSVTSAPIPQPIVEQPAAQPVSAPETPATPQVNMDLGVPTSAQIDSAVTDALSVPRAPASTPPNGQQKNTPQEQDKKTEQKAFDIDQDIQNRLKAIDDRIKARYDADQAKKSLGNRLLTGLAVALGGIGQSLTGSRSNVALDIINQQVEQRAQADKLDLEEKESLRRLYIQNAQNKIAELQQKTNDQYRKDMINVQLKQLAAAQKASSDRVEAELRARTAASSKYTGQALSPEDLATLTEKQRNKLVTLPGNRKVLVDGEDDKKAFNTVYQEVNKSLPTIKFLKDLSKKGSKFSLLDREKYAAAAEVLKGALRIPITGPGVLTPQERQELLGIIGQPLSLTTLRYLENAKLNQLERELKGQVEATAQTYGINEKVYGDNKYLFNGKPALESEILANLKAKRPNIPDDTLLLQIRRTLPSAD